MATDKGQAAKQATPPAVQATGGPVAQVLPEWMKGKAGIGTENLTSQDVEMPRIKLIQGISEELQTFDGLKAGQFFHTLAEQALGEKIDVVPIYLSKRYVLWRPRPPIDMGGILARADDAVHWKPADTEFVVKVDKKGTQVKWKTAKTVAQSGLDKWGSYDPSDPKSQPAATECHVIVVALPKMPEFSPVALFLQRGFIRPARKWLGKLKISNAPIYGTVWSMSSLIDHGDSGDYHNYQFTANGFVQDPELGKQYEALYESFKRSGVKVKMEDEGPSSSGGATDDSAAQGRY